MFNATQQRKKDEQTAWDEFRTLQASLGSTHPDILNYMHSFTRSLRNWGNYQTAEMIIGDTLKSGEHELLAHRPEVLQTMLSGLMVILIDQKKLVEAENLWNTSIGTFRSKLGEHSTNILEKQFQQAHPFRRSSLPILKGTVFSATINVKIEPLSITTMHLLLRSLNTNLTRLNWDKSFSSSCVHSSSRFGEEGKAWNWLGGLGP